MRIIKDKLISDYPLRVFKLNVGDVFFIDKDTLIELCGGPVSVGIRLALGSVEGIAASVKYTKRKWYQFWKRKKIAGYLVEIVEKAV